MSKFCVFEIQIEFGSKRNEYLNRKSVLRQDFFFFKFMKYILHIYHYIASKYKILKNVIEIGGNNLCFTKY